jgi:hypothetical protein
MYKNKKLKDAKSQFIQVSLDTWKHPNGYTIKLISECFYDLVDSEGFSVWDFETFEHCIILDNYNGL